MGDFNNLVHYFNTIPIIDSKKSLLEMKTIIDSYLDKLPKDKIGSDQSRDRLKSIYDKMRQSSIADIDSAVVKFTVDMIKMKDIKFNRQDYAFLIDSEIENCEDRIYFQAPQYMLMLHCICKLNV